MWLALLAPLSARALTLRVERGATCLDEAELRLALAQVSPPDGLRSAADVEVIGSSHDPRTVVMRVHHPDGAVFERTFSPAPERCPHLHQAVALALSLALKAIPASAEAAGDVRVAESRVQGVVLGLGPLLGVGVGAGWALGGELSAGLQFRHAALRVTGLAARATRVDLGSGYFDTISVAARVDGCGRLGLSSLARPRARFDKREVHGELCVVALAGLLYLRGGGQPYTMRDKLRQLGVGIDLGVEWQWAAGTELRAGGALVAGLEPLDVVVRAEDGTKLDQQRLPPVVGLFVVALRYDFFTRRTAFAKASARSDMKE